jgi:hypothetical protein
MPESRIGPAANILGINTSPPVARLDVAGSTGDTIPTVRVRGANQTGAVVDIDSTGFPGATSFFRVYMNNARTIEVNSNFNVFIGSIVSNGNNEWTQSAGRLICFNQSSDTVIPFNVAVNSTFGGTSIQDNNLAFQIQSGSSDNISPNGVQRFGVFAKSGCITRRTATTTTSLLAAFGTVTLVAGTATVTNTFVAATDIIRVNLLNPNTTATPSVAYCPGTIIAGTSFVVRGLTAAAGVNAADVSTVTWEIIRPLANTAP